MKALIIPTREKALRLLETGRKALAEARTFADVKTLRDQAAAVQHFMKQQRLSGEAAQDAAELKVRAERRLGELLESETVKGGKRHKSQDGICERRRSIPDGVTTTESSRWQKSAAIPEPEFEQHIAVCRERNAEITTAGVMRLAKSIKKESTSNGDGFEDGCTVDDLSKLKGKFGCIMADPPWRYGNQGTRASTDNHYQTMTVEELAALPIGELAADESHLWLWTTNGFLFECPKLFTAWGFEFKSSYVWVKPQIGIGNYLRNAHEFLLLAVRGGLVGRSKNTKSWGEFERGEHSAKPGRIRMDVVEQVSPGPYLELFGREQIPGWTVWGNQIAKNLFGTNGDSND